MRIEYSEQYQMNCVVIESGARPRAEVVIALCEDNDAVSTEDGVEYCVQLRADVGPELWTENALRRSIG